MAAEIAREEDSGAVVQSAGSERFSANHHRDAQGSGGAGARCEGDFALRNTMLWLREPWVSPSSNNSRMLPLHEPCRTEASRANALVVQGPCRLRIPHADMPI